MDSGTADSKVRENWLRRVAERQAYRLQKSPRRDPRAADYGRWRIVNPTTRTVIVGTGPLDYTMTLAQVEHWLLSYEMCARCGRRVSVDASESVEWEALSDDRGNDLGTICPDCVTPAEQQAMDDADMGMA